ncbi:MAG TPA: ATP synthase F1 subunit epsilon [Spirochaetia bacterium]
MPDAGFRFTVLSPQGTAFAGLARSVRLPTVDGEISVLAHHMPLVAVLTDGEVLVDTGQGEVSIAIAGGFLDTTGAKGGEWEATVLSDFATQSDSIEVARVEAAKARAEHLLAEKRERGELQLVERDLQRAILQLKIAEKARGRRRAPPPQA